MDVCYLESEFESSPQSGPPGKGQFQKVSRQPAGDATAFGFEVGTKIVILEAICDEVGCVFTELLNQEKIGVKLAQDSVEMGDVCPAAEQVGGHQPDGLVHGRSTLTRPSASQIVEKLLKSRLGRWTYMPSEYV